MHCVIMYRKKRYANLRAYFNFFFFFFIEGNSFTPDRIEYWALQSVGFTKYTVVYMYYASLREP